MMSTTGVNRGWNLRVNFTLFLFLKKISLFFYCWLCWVFTAARAFSSCSEWALLSGCGAQPSHCGGFSVAEHRL